MHTHTYISLIHMHTYISLMHTHTYISHMHTHIYLTYAIYLTYSQASHVRWVRWKTRGSDSQSSSSFSSPCARVRATKSARHCSTSATRPRRWIARASTPKSSMPSICSWTLGLGSPKPATVLCWWETFKEKFSALCRFVGFLGIRSLEMHNSIAKMHPCGNLSFSWPPPLRSQRHQVYMEGDYISLLLSVAMLEGMMMQLDPEFSMLDSAIPYIAQYRYDVVRSLR